MQFRTLYKCLFFFFNDTATTEIYTLSLHDALPISGQVVQGRERGAVLQPRRRLDDVGLPARAAVRHGDERPRGPAELPLDRKSTRLNSSHANISYAVFCLKKK